MMFDLKTEAKDGEAASWQKRDVRAVHTVRYNQLLGVYVSDIGEKIVRVCLRKDCITGGNTRSDNEGATASIAARGSEGAIVCGMY